MLKNGDFVPDLKVPYDIIFKAKALHVALTEYFSQNAPSRIFFGAVLFFIFLLQKAAHISLNRSSTQQHIQY